LHSDLTGRRELFGDTATELLDHCEARGLAGNGSVTFSPEVPRRLTELPHGRITELLERRRSVREYADAPVSREHLADICGSGLRARTLLTGGPAEDPHADSWLVWARNVEGLSPGIHTYDGAGDFTSVTPLPDDLTWSHAIQSDFVESPCLVLPLWKLDSALTADGTDGYLNSLLAAGSSLYTSWLTALDLGLVGCLLRGVHPALLSSALGMGGVGARPLLTLSLGHPLAPDTTGETS
jgi:hypothetical protein